MRKNVPEDLRKIVEVLFDPEQHNRLKDIIIRFKLSFGTQYAYEELLNHLKTKFIDEAIAEDVLLHALGWVKKGIDNAVERDEPPIIDVDEFRAEISSFRTRLIGRSYLPSFAGPPSFEEVELHRLRTFVRQLDLIEVSEDRILACIADFLSARTNRAEYASRGYVHRESLREFERTLASLWENHRDEIELNVNEDAITRGKKLAFRCLRETARLEGIDVPADFVRGCFHALADIPSIGWHPRYEALLSNPEGE